MRHTNSILMIYGVPTVILTGLLLATFGIVVPWYLWGAGSVVVAFVLTLLVGSIALAREERNATPNRADVWGAAFGTLAFALKNPDPKVRRDAAETLANVRDGRAVEPLCRALLDPDPEVRYWAAESLAIVRDARSVEPLCHALRDPDLQVKRAVVRALEQVGDERAFEALREPLREPKSYESQMWRDSLLALFQMDTARAMEPFSVALQDPATSNAAIVAIQDTSKPSHTIDTIRRYYQSKNRAVPPHVEIEFERLRMGL
jgi:HEAT repeat protein